MSVFATDVHTVRTKLHYYNSNVKSCLFNQKKIVNIICCVSHKTMGTFLKKFTSTSWKTSWTSSAEDKEEAQDNDVFFTTFSLTLHHWLNVICSEHLSDTQHPVLLQGKDNFKSTKSPTQSLKWNHLKFSTCLNLVLEQWYIKVCPAAAHIFNMCPSFSLGDRLFPKYDLILT